MGLIKAAAGAVGGVLADQWKEFFYCEAIPRDILVVKGQKRITSRSSNTKGNDNIISNGSGIAVADGQAMIIVEQGKVVEYCEIPGEYTYDTSTEPSIFAGSFGESILNTFKLIGKRFTYGGDTGKDQRVYYFNMKEITENPFGTPDPVPFRIVDKNINLDIDVSIRCNGFYSYKIKNPLLFYTNVCGNVAESFKRKEIDAQLKSEFTNALQPCFGKISAMQIRPNEIPARVDDVCAAMNQVLSQKWLELRGIAVVSVAFNVLNIPPEDMEIIKQAQRAAINRDPGMAAATLTQAQADAMKDAAKNKGGSMNAFLGMGMAQNAGGINAQQLFEMSAQQQAARQQAEAQAAQQAAQQKQADPQGGWKCECGTVNQGKFCMNCGTMKPAGAPLYRCDKCGWQPEDPHNPPRFCPECGDIFDEKDIR